MRCSRSSPSQGPRPTCFHVGQETWLELACLSVECANTFYIFTQIDISIIHDYFLSIKTEIYFGKVVVNALQQGFFHKSKTAKKENNFFKHFINFNKLKKNCHCTAAGTQWELVRLSVECASPCGRPSFLATIWPENDQIHGFGQRKQNKQSEAKIGHMTIDLCPGRQLHKNREQTDSFLFKGKE